MYDGKHMKNILTVIAFALAMNMPASAAEIVRDGEFEYLWAQHGEKWAAQDKLIDARLADIRNSNGGKHPNIVYILIDDVSFGILGNRAMNYVTGIDTPNINDFAEQGLSLMRRYTEPSCKPTRTAMLTGRHQVRDGQEEVKVALVGEGLAAVEVTIAEILKKSGYNTAHVGKWHQGDIEQSYPHHPGFDWAAFPVHQQVQLSLMTRDAMKSNNMIGLDPSGQTNPFAIDNRFKPYGLVTGLEAEAGKMAREVHMQPGEVWTQ